MRLRQHVVPGERRDRHVKVDRDDAAAARDRVGEGLERLPGVAEHHVLVEDLGVLLAHELVAQGHQVQEIRRVGVLVLRTRTHDLTGVVQRRRPLQHRADVDVSGSLTRRVHVDPMLLRGEERDRRGLARDRAEIGVVVRPELQHVVVVVGIAGVAFAVREEDGADAVGLVRQRGA